MEAGEPREAGNSLRPNQAEASGQERGHGGQVLEVTRLETWSVKQKHWHHF